MQQMQTGDTVASYKRHKRGSDANPGASGNHSCLCALPSAFPGTYQTQNGAQGFDDNELAIQPFSLNS